MLGFRHGTASSMAPSTLKILKSPYLIHSKIKSPVAPSSKSPEAFSLLQCGGPVCFQRPWQPSHSVSEREPFFGQEILLCEWDKEVWLEHLKITTS